MVTRLLTFFRLIPGTGKNFGYDHDNFSEKTNL